HQDTQFVDEPHLPGNMGECALPVYLSTGAKHFLVAGTDARVVPDSSDSRSFVSDRHFLASAVLHTGITYSGMRYTCCPGSTQRQGNGPQGIYEGCFILRRPDPYDTATSQLAKVVQPDGIASSAPATGTSEWAPVLRIIALALARNSWSCAAEAICNHHLERAVGRSS